MIHTIKGRFTEWRPMGYGGGTGVQSFDRYIATVRGMRNGTYLDVVLELPGQPAARLLLTEHGLREALDLGHGAEFELRVETDVWTKPGVVHVFDPKAVSE